MAACSACGKPRKKQGGQEVCMNPACSEYLVGKDSSKAGSPVTKAIREQIR